MPEIEGFKIGEGYVEITSKVDDTSIAKDAERTGERFEETFTRTVGGRMRDHKGRFIKAGEEAIVPGGSRAGKGFGSRLVSGIGSILTSPKIKKMFTTDIVSGLGEGIMGFVKSPVGLAAIAAFVGTAGTLIASGLAATISAGLVGGLGFGGIGLAAWLLKDRPRIRKAAESLGKDIKKRLTTSASVLETPFVKGLNILRTKLVPALMPAFDALFKGLAPAIVPLANGLAGAVREMVPGLTALATKAGPFLIDLAAKLPGMGKSLGDFLGKLAANWPVIEKSFFSFMHDAGAVLGALATAFIWLSTHYTQVRKTLATMILIFNPLVLAIAAVVKAFGWFKNDLPKIVSNAAATVSGWVSGTIGWFQKLGNGITGYLNRAANAVGSWVSGVVSWFGALPGRIGRALVALPGVIAQAINWALTRGAFLVGYGLGRIVGFFLKLPGRAKAAVAKLWSAMAGAFSHAVSSAKSRASALVSGTISFFQRLPGRAKAAVARLWASMTGAFSAAASGARTKANALVNGFMSILRGLPGKARSAASKVKGAVTGAFSGAGRWLYSAGANIIRGVIGGIGSMIGGAVGAARRAAQSIVNGFKSALKIGSPSVVAADEVGRWLPPGIVQGVRKAMPKAQRDIAAMTPRLATGAAQGMAKTSSVTNAQTYMGGITVNVYAAPGMNVDQLSTKTVRKLSDRLARVDRSSF